MTKRIAIVGGGIAGLTAAWQIAQHARDGEDVEATLFESSGRLGGIVETVCRDGFVVECGPDGWVSEKPWARQLAIKLGLKQELLGSNDATRKTHILIDGQLETMPDGMRMMVPTDLAAVERSHLFSSDAKSAYGKELTRAAELRTAAPSEDESIASFTFRHFGEEVLTRIAVPLLSGVLGGDVETLSVQAVLPQFVDMEREHGSLIEALRIRTARAPATSIFTTLRGGLGTLVEQLTAGIPPGWIRRATPVDAVAPVTRGWSLEYAQRPVGGDIFDWVVLATPPHVTRDLLQRFDPEAAELLHMEATTAIIVAFGYLDAASISLPPGFGFLVPPSASAEVQLLACTFVDQKFADRAPANGCLLRAFFGGRVAEALLTASDEQIVRLAQLELERILGTLPTPAFTITRRWPRSLPQYHVGHRVRMAALDRRVGLLRGLRLIGNAYRGVGLPDLIRDARMVADACVSGDEERAS